jgi:broad specificity phosphatase PhoE
LPFAFLDVTRLLLIPAAPTPWDLEGRLGGNPTLPLEADGEIAIRDALKSIPNDVAAVYTFRGSAACEQAARLVAKHFNCRLRDEPLLEPVSMGLWQGLTRDEVRRRFPSVVAQWDDDPLSVQPPEGESIPAAAERFDRALRKILRRRKGETAALVLRPIAFQITLGLLRKQPLTQVATHLHDPLRMETIEVEDE